MPQTVLLVAILILQFVLVVMQGIPTTEYSALYNIYNATSGNHWNWNYSLPIWIFNNASTNDPCIKHWQGLLCNSNCSPSQPCNVLAIQLNNYTLSGTLPTSIGSFSLL